MGDPETSMAAPSNISNDTRMKLYEQREKEFLEFINETRQVEVVQEDSNGKPLSGLQCLLALTEILERAAQLRLTNFDLEQKIDVLQRLKQIAEVQNDLRNATLDLNGVVRGKKSKPVDETDGSRIKRTLSAESINAFHSPISKFDHSSDDFSKHRGTQGKGSRLSETWGKVKVKLAPKDVTHTTQASKQGRRRANTDQSGSLRHSLSTEGTSHATSLVQFTQREIDVAPSATDDFGGVWLGDDTGDSAPDSSDFGGVWLGPPSITPPPALILDVNRTDQKWFSKEELGRQSSDPVTQRSGRRSRETWARVRSTSCDECQDWVTKTPHEDVASPPMLRKKSSKPKLLGLLPGSEQKKMKKGEPNEELPKEFRKKIEEWQTIKETGTSSPTREDITTTAKSGKVSKGKSQRFKNKKKTSLLKQRSKSAERVQDSSTSQGHSEDFEAKLREWSVKQGYHPSYYSDIRNSKGSSDSISEQSSKDSSEKRLHKVERVRMVDGVEDQTLVLDINPSSCTDSTTSFSPSNTVHFHSTDNLQTLNEISQSADVVFHRETPASAQSSRQLSRSEEAINSVTTSTLLTPQIEQSASATSSHVDLYARASDQSLEKHLSLFHVTSESCILGKERPNSETLDDSSVATTDETNRISTLSLSSHCEGVEVAEDIKCDETQIVRDLPVHLEIAQKSEDDYQIVRMLQSPTAEEVSITIAEPIVECQDITSGADVDNKDTDHNISLQLSTSSTSIDKPTPELESPNCEKSESTNGTCLVQEDTTSTEGGPSYDINSNVTDSSAAEQEDAKPTLNSIEIIDPLLHIGSDVPLKTRLKSLALEYEQESPNNVQTKPTRHYGQTGSSHKRTRSYDSFSQSATRQQTTLANNFKKQTSSNVRSMSIPNSSTQWKPTAKQTGTMNNFNNLTKTQHSTIHRLKSADELIYGQSLRSKNINASRQTAVGSVQYPYMDVRNRREMYEKPKEGTVKKALTRFLDGGAFNAQFGTDFARAPRTQPT